MKNNIPLPIQKYLNKYLISGWNIESDVGKKYNNIVVIPAISEFENIKNLLGSLLKLNSEYLPSTLFLFIINNKKNISQEIKNNNKKSLELLNNIINNEELKNDAFISSVINSNINIGFIDASSPGKELPNKTAGVGLARKIGMDCALKYFNYENTKKNILICLDADCGVSQNYLSKIVKTFNEDNVKAAVIRYEHNIKDNNILTSAIICYEIFLRYYQLGLLYADSPYALPTIGSAMACDADSYVMVEGMNKRKAAEDFYFLEKLTKNVEIHQINDVDVYPSGRESWRVPFGTGQRVGRFLTEKKDEYVLFNPLSFKILKNWLSLFLNDTKNDTESILRNSKRISQNLYKFLTEQKIINIMNGIINNSKTKRQLYNQKIKWFDGFKTLKLIHYLRDNGYPEINMFDALDELFKMLNINFDCKKERGEIPTIEIQKKYLIEMRKYIYGN